MRIRGMLSLLAVAMMVNLNGAGVAHAGISPSPAAADARAKAIAGSYATQTGMTPATALAATPMRRSSRHACSR